MKKFSMLSSASNTANVTKNLPASELHVRGQSTSHGNFCRNDSSAAAVGVVHGGALRTGMLHFVIPSPKGYETVH